MFRNCFRTRNKKNYFCLESDFGHRMIIMRSLKLAMNYLPVDWCNYYCVTEVWQSQWLVLDLRLIWSWKSFRKRQSGFGPEICTARMLCSSEFFCHIASACLKFKSHSFEEVLHHGREKSRVGWVWNIYIFSMSVTITDQLPFYKYIMLKYL